MSPRLAAGSRRSTIRAVARPRPRRSSPGVALRPRAQRAERRLARGRGGGAGKARRLGFSPGDSCLVRGDRRAPCSSLGAAHRGMVTRFAATADGAFFEPRRRLSGVRVAEDGFDGRDGGTRSPRTSSRAGRTAGREDFRNWPRGLSSTRAPDRGSRAIPICSGAMQRSLAGPARRHPRPAPARPTRRRGDGARVPPRVPALRLSFPPTGRRRTPRRSRAWGVPLIPRYGLAPAYFCVDRACQAPLHSPMTSSRLRFPAICP